MNFLKNRLGLVLALGVVLAIAAGLGWSSHRFNRISLCTSCHEIFVNYDEYKPVGATSQSKEDFNPIQQPDPGLFNVTVGCAECHAYPYEEYRKSPHFDNERGVKPGCVGCHAPHTVYQFLNWKFFYLNKGGYGESPFHEISSGLRDIPEWERLRVDLAKQARKQMVAENSARCKNCHKPDGEWFKKLEPHTKTEKTCVECHHSIVHKAVEWDVK
ncbi:MAG: NapC/NirT family cytochrome c [Magnetococcus sp. DMHC-8]